MDDRTDRFPRQHFLSVAMLLAVTGLLLTAAWASGGRSYVEKVLTALVMPGGLMWLALIALLTAAWQTGRRGFAAAFTAIAVLYTLSGSTLVGDRLMLQLEGPFTAVEPADIEPFDQLIVLGGGTEEHAGGTVLLGSAGDRVMLAARLYHRGKAKRLLATGSLFDWGGRRIDPAQAAQRMWLDLDIPASAITIIGGRNTAEEMREIRRRLDPAASERVGLITSAWHMPRAVRLAQHTGLQVVPVAANFETGTPDTWLLGLIPSYEGFRKNERFAKEILAGLARR